MPSRPVAVLAFVLLFNPVALAQPVEPAGRASTRVEAPLTPAQLQEDFRFLVDRIRAIHPNPYREVPREVFDRAVAELEARIPETSVAESVVTFLRVLALTRDGHTTMPLGFAGFGDEASDRIGFRRLPIRLYDFENGLTVVAATPAWRWLLRARVKAIGGIPVERAFALAAEVVPSDNEMGRRDRAVVLLEIPEIVAALGLAENADRVSMTFETATGIETVSLAPAAPDATWQPAREPGERPLYLRHSDRNYWEEFLPDGRLYVQYDAVVNQGEESIAAFFERIFREAEERAVDTMILDMRFNTGGNNALNWPIVYGLLRSKSLNRPGHFFVLIGRRTFSAAQNGVNEIERHTNAVFVGEPTAAHPNHYGDAMRFTMPNSKLPFYVSTLYWQNHPRDTRAWTPSQVYAPPTAAAYATNGDPALDAIDTWDPTALFDRLLARLDEGGARAALEAYAAFRADPRNRFVDAESDLNRIGYRLLGGDELEGALEVFRLVVETHPDSANAHDSYGEALWRAGDIEAAVAEYERAMELDPDGLVGRHARSMLERIRSGEPPP